MDKLCDIVPCHVKHTHEDVDGKTQAQIALAREHASTAGGPQMQ